VRFLVGGKLVAVLEVNVAPPFRAAAAVCGKCKGEDAGLKPGLYMAETPGAMARV